jgi:hypothetical protein
VLDDSLKVAPGETARTVMARFLRETLGERYDTDLSRFSDAEVIDTIEYHLFPNMILFPGVSLPMVYRFRPLGMNTDKTLFEILFLRPLPRSGNVPDAPERVHVTEEQSYDVVPGMDPFIAHVYDQDTANLRAQQQGFKASKKGAQTLGNYQEVRIRHFESVVDSYVAKAK